MVKDIKRDKNDLFAYAPTRFLFRNEKVIFAVRAVTVFLFAYALYLGFVAEPEENTFTTAIFWSIFWPFFMFLTLPTLGSLFCGICPHGYIGKYITKFGLQKEMPKALKNPIWGLLVVVLFYWSVIYVWPGALKAPVATALFFAVFTLVAFGLFYLFKDMSYCKSLCPIGSITTAFSKVGFGRISTYGEHCASCKTFDCAKACEYKLSPFNFEKKGAHYDCKSCMDCAIACDAVKFELVKPLSGVVSEKTKKSFADVWTYLAIAAVGTITMGLHHGIGRTGAAPDMIWSKIGAQINTLGLGVDGVGLAALLSGIIASAFFALGGLFVASRLLNRPFGETMLSYGYVFAPIMIIGGASHAFSFFFMSYYHTAVNGFIWAFNLSFENVKPLASMKDAWIRVFSLFNYLAVIASMFIAYKKVSIENVKFVVKGAVFAAVSAFAIFYLFLVVYRQYAMMAYGPLKCH